jgi:hypothetical protein
LSSGIRSVAMYQDDRLAPVLAAVKTRVLMALTCRWMLVDVKLAGIVAARLRGWCRRARGRPGRYAPPAAVPCGHP